MQNRSNVFQVDFDAVEREVREYEKQQAAELGIETARQQQWVDENPNTFTLSQREHTTVLFGGLTMMQDAFIQAACRGLGYRFQALEVPDNAAMQVGKEFGNRGQCNPTYFTVGNLVKYLIHLRDVEGIPTEEIVNNYVYVTAGACGPCRFGMYVTEYRKALRDAGFEGFRVLLFQQSGESLRQSSEEQGLKFNVTFFKGLLGAMILGDVINLMGYRLRPYEVNEGEVDSVLAECKQLIIEQLEANKKIMPVLREVKKRLSAIELNRLQSKPKVSVIGEFWAMTTEGDGNYKLQRFLEKEGAEVDIQPVTNWLLYLIWEFKYDTRERMKLKMSLKERFEAYKLLAILKIAEKFIQSWFYRYANAVGLVDYHLADMHSLADDAHDFYANELRGGEGHMEVGKLIQAVKYKKSHLVLSVKPFGCMPSSGVSDGVQSLVTGMYPDANFLAIETSGDGAVNVYSRVQMALFKARQKATQELDSALQSTGRTVDQLHQHLQQRGLLHGSWYPRHTCASTAANIVHHLTD